MNIAKITGAALLAALLAACGTSTPGPMGSKHQTQNGVSGSSNYPAGNPKDAESPALSSSSEQAHSNPSPKVPKPN